MANPTSGTRGKDELRTVGQAAQDVKDRGEEAAGTAMDRAREVASNVADKARDAASTVGQRADDAASSVGGGLKSLAGTLRDRGPQEGVLGNASEKVASGLEQGGRYLQQEGVSGMMDDLAGLIRRNPVPALLIGIGVGFLLARTTSRS